MNPEILIPLLVFLSVTLVGGAVMIPQVYRKKVLQDRLETAGIDEKLEPKQNTKLLNFLQKVGNLVSHGRASTSLYEQLVRAGYMANSAPAMYAGIKMLLFVIGVGITCLLVIPMQNTLLEKMTLIIVGGSILFFIPNLVISMQAQKRHQEIFRHLPDAIDLLEICVSSGIGLDMAWNIVADEIQPVCPVLSNAMELTNFEIHLGAGRAQAMKHMATRTAVQDLSSLAALLVQSERFGTSIAETLKIFASTMREERSFAIEESAEKMAVKLILPMVLFIFPAVLIIAVGPAAITIAKEIIFGT